MFGKNIFKKTPLNPLSHTDNKAVVDCAFYEHGQRQETDIGLLEAAQLARESKHGFVWIGLLEPTTEQFEEIALLFELHPLPAEDAVHAHQRPKLEVYTDLLFMVLKSVAYIDHEEVIETGEIMLFVGEHFLITVHHGLTERISELRKSIEEDQKVLSAGPGAVFYVIIDRIVDDYAHAIEGVATDIEEVEAQVFDPSATDPSQRIYKLKREVLEFRRAVEPLGPALERLATENFMSIDAKHNEYFRDVHDHVLRNTDAIRSHEELLSSALQANVSQVNLRLNRDMRKITAWAAILTVIAAIAGVYGMNFEHMPELHWRYGYLYALVFIAVVCGTMYFNFRRRKWL